VTTALSEDLLHTFASTRTRAQVARDLSVDERTVRRWLARDVTVSQSALKLVHALTYAPPAQPKPKFTFIDLFAGIGGTRLGFESAGGRCAYTAEWNKFAQQTYTSNFRNDHHHELVGDITRVDAATVPDHDVLVAGFPCQPFSIAGVSKKNALGRAHGFQDATQGTLFFDVARIIDEKRPRAFMLENVKNLVSHDRGRTFRVIKETLENELGYHVQYRVINAAPWVPQGRQRIFIVGFDAPTSFDFDEIPIPEDRPTMRDVLHPEDGTEPAEPPYTNPDGTVSSKYTLTPRLWQYLQDYKRKHTAAGNGFGFGLVGPDDIARTLSARYYKDGSEILVSRGEGNIPRRLTPRECARLMGFPDTYRITVSDTQAYRQFGNSVVVPVIESIAAVMERHL